MSSFVASIIICTHNRADSLRETLRAMARCAVPPEAPTELLIVDNGSTDGTRAVVDEAEVPRMTVRYLFEPAVGQCHARNLGLREACGEVILFTDDDVQPPENWLAEMCGPILRGEADAVAGGVRIAPGLERPWFNQGLFRTRLASTDQLDAENPATMVGANMAFSRRVLEKVERFDVALGPGALGFEDDALFAHQLLHAGYRLQPRLDVMVEHHFDVSRLNRASMLLIAQRAGRSLAYVWHHWEHRSLRWPFLRWLKAIFHLTWWRLTHVRTWWVKREINWEEWNWARWVAFYPEFLKASRQPRNYERFGLRRIVAPPDAR